MWLQGRLQQLLTTQVGQGQGRPRFILGVCPRRQIVGNVTRTFRMDSSLRRAKESCVPAATPQICLMTGRSGEGIFPAG